MGAATWADGPPIGPRGAGNGGALGSLDWKPVFIFRIQEEQLGLMRTFSNQHDWSVPRQGQQLLVVDLMERVLDGAGCVDARFVQPCLQILLSTLLAMEADRIKPVAFARTAKKASGVVIAFGLADPFGGRWSHVARSPVS